MNNSNKRKKQKIKLPTLPTPKDELWINTLVPNPLTQLVPELSSVDDDNGEKDGEE
jgi:hypothetical protein